MSFHLSGNPGITERTIKYLNEILKCKNELSDIKINFEDFNK